MSKPESLPDSKLHGGSTLVEILAVTVLFAALAVIALHQYHGARERSTIATVQHDLHTVAVRQEACFAEHHTYAESAAPTDYVASPGVEVTVTVANATGWAATANHRILPNRSCGV